jgi:hypothetical protein
MFRFLKGSKKMIKSSAVSKLAGMRLLGVVLVLGLAMFGLASPTHAEAAITMYTHEIPQSFLLDTACAAPGQEEEIAVSLTAVTQYIRIADAGGNFHWTVSQSWKNATAVGVSSGNSYQVLFRARAVMNTGTAAREFTSLYDMKLVGPNGDTSVYTYHITAHYTLNADGTLANYIWEFTNECR